MHYFSFLYPALLATSSFIGAEAANTRSSNGNKVKLSNVQSLTLRKGLETSHRRVSAMPQVQRHPQDFCLSSLLTMLDSYDASEAQAAATTKST